MKRATLAIYCRDKQTRDQIMEDNKEILSSYDVIWVVDFFHERVKIELIY